MDHFLSIHLARFFLLGIFFLTSIYSDMSLFKHTSRNYIFYSLSCLVILLASLTFILSLYRLQRDASLLNRERKRDYVTNKINKSFPTIAIIMSIIVCISSILGFITVLLHGRTEMLITSIVSNIILGIGLIVLGVIMLGFVQNIVENFPVDIERLLVDFIIHNKTSARDELLRIENSNDCCTTQDSTWTKGYSQAAECNREEKHRMIYADQDEQRGCVKVISRTALALMPVLISEMICGCLCLFLGLWTIFMSCHIHNHYNTVRSNDNLDEVELAATPLTKYPYYQTNSTIHNLIPQTKINDNQTNKLMESYATPRRTYTSLPSNKTDRPLHVHTIAS